jgi:hypothetical protein
MTIFSLAFSKQSGIANWVRMLKHKFTLNSIPGVQMHTVLYAYYELRSLRLPSESKLMEQFTETLASVPFRILFL